MGFTVSPGCWIVWWKSPSCRLPRLCFRTWTSSWPCSGISLASPAWRIRPSQASRTCRALSWARWVQWGRLLWLSRMGFCRIAQNTSFCTPSGCSCMSCSRPWILSGCLSPGHSWQTSFSNGRWPFKSRSCLHLPWPTPISQFWTSVVAAWRILLALLCPAIPCSNFLAGRGKPCSDLRFPYCCYSQITSLSGC